MTRRRRVVDRRTWFDVKVPKRPDAVLQTMSFRLLMPLYHEQGPVSRYELDYDQTIRHPVLEYHFITPKEDNGDGFDTEMDECDQRIWTSYYSQKCDELKDRLDELTLLELANSPAEKRPAEYDLLASDLEIASSLRGKFEIPDTQSYYDDDVIAFLAEAWEDQAKYDELEEAEQAKRKSQEIAKVRIDPF